ncbi:disulfide bond formation protein DsbA [Acetobacter musti]|uniref:Disulfide bond formation protein DsbA n=1 Tax=Acetobacter musti TaxID=864732 RepID=A0ABX0JP23_9PROT|nr:DsbA family oxidoreductase [Acetobacter musti]NHN83838.1 disulfide bond formation protein DsbA [Acetobacter musti]
MSITIIITSDFICPWCFVGERRLEKALKTLPEKAAVEIEWRPFELNPAMPPEGMDRKIYRTLKFGSWERSRALDTQTVAATEHDDIAFDYDAMARTPNTFQAHRLMWFADRQGLATPVAKALFSAYFEQGRDIGDVAVLCVIAGEQGLDRQAVEAFFASDQGLADVRNAEDAHRHQGVRSVPLFDIAGTIISGAQAVEIFEKALKQATELDQSCVEGSCSVG